MTGADEGRLRPVAKAYVWTQLVPAIILVVFLVGSLLFSGGQVFADRSPGWDVVIPFPLFPVPWWLFAGLGVVGLGCALTWALRAAPRESLGLTGAFGVTCAGGFAALYFEFAFMDDPVLSGPYWIGAASSAVAAIVLVTAGIVTGRRARASAESEPGSA